MQTADPAALEAGPDMPQPGTLLDHRFLITDVLSKSGMAMLFLAQDTDRARAEVVVKVPHLSMESDLAFFTRFQREEEIGLTLDHPFLLKFVPVDGAKSRPYIVTEYIRGSTLNHTLSAAGRPFSEEDAFILGLALCDALAYLHGRGIVHRDVKPDNIMIGRDGTIRLLDFGLSHSQGMRRVTFAGFSPAMGTPEYMSPEQARGGRGDERSDIYSVGAVLYRLLTGRHPFTGESPMAILALRGSSDPLSPRTHRPELSAQAEEIVLHAMARNPDHRYQAIGELAADLRTPSAVLVTDRGKHLKKKSRLQTKLTLYRGALLLIGLPAALIATTAVWMWLRFGGK